MKGFGNARGSIETGYVDFTGQSEKLVELVDTSYPANILVTIVENQDIEAAENKETDIPSRNIGNIQAAAYWAPGEKKKFYITTSAEFYGRIQWYVGKQL